MPIATPDKYNAMIDAAKAGGYAFPAVNVTSSQTLNAAIRGFAEAESDGIIQVSTGGAAYWSGASVKDMVVGSLGFAAFARQVAKNYGVNIALHTDHCPADKLYSTVEDALATIDALGAGEKGRYITALTFGNVHGVYKPGNVKLRPELLKDIQDKVGAKIGKANPFDLVFHGGSGSARWPATCSPTTTAC